MSLLNNNKSPTQKGQTDKQKPLKKRFFAGATRDHTNSDFIGSPSLNTDLKYGLKPLRDRARTLSLNNSYARRYLELCKTNIVGANGVRVSVMAMNPDGSIDPASRSIQSNWNAFNEDCDVSGQFTLQKLEELAIESIARDGEALFIIHRGLSFGKYNIQLQAIDPDHLDERYNGYSDNGNRIIQGVEIDDLSRPIAYHLWKFNPYDDPSLNKMNERVRYLAKDVIHIFDAERAGQCRGYSWLAPVMNQLDQLDKFREAALVAARLAASKGHFFSQGENADPLADPDDIDDFGNLSMQISPGMAEILPIGWDVKAIEFDGNEEALDAFQKNILRGVAAGLSVSYNALASDAESVNYSSARFNALTDNDQYKSIQSLLINKLIKRVYEEWLSIQLLTDQWGLGIPVHRFQKFCNCRYVPRAFGTVDPEKDAKSDILQLENNMVSLSEIVERRGRSLEDVLIQKQKDAELLKKYGLSTPDIRAILEE